MPATYNGMLICIRVDENGVAQDVDFTGPVGFTDYPNKDSQQSYPHMPATFPNLGAFVTEAVAQFKTDAGIP